MLALTLYALALPVLSYALPNAFLNVALEPVNIARPAAAELREPSLLFPEPSASTPKIAARTISNNILDPTPTLESHTAPTIHPFPTPPPALKALVVTKTNMHTAFTTVTYGNADWFKDERNFPQLLSWFKECHPDEVRALDNWLAAKNKCDDQKCEPKLRKPVNCCIDFKMKGDAGMSAACQHWWPAPPVPAV